MNDAHYLSYGLGYQKEDASGSRLKNAPKTYTKMIDPWDYDKSLAVEDNTAGVDDTPSSYVHDHKFIRNENGFIWDSNTEYYGSDAPPPMTYEEASRIDLGEYFMNGIIRDNQGILSDAEMKAKYDAFNNLLKAQNDFTDPKI